ncbi:MAG TPA: PhzF family phenazine biosynthesis protein [Actinomycetota bacterium]
MRVPFRMVDVFAERPFEGNRLCVVPETPPDLETRAMQTLALEINFSETTFVTAVRPDGYDVRIFTPDAELPFAGHPTLGTAFVLASEGRTGTETVQRCAAGDIPVEVDLAAGRAVMHQLPPAFGRTFDDRDAVARAAGLATKDLVEGLPIVPASTGIWHLMVPVRDEAALRRASRHARTADVCAVADHVESLYLFTVRGDGDVMARMFDRGEGIGEDPATGSAAGPLGAYLAQHGLAGVPGDVTIAQGELTGRPSRLDVRVEPDGATWRVSVAGGVRRVGEGVFEL